MAFVRTDAGQRIVVCNRNFSRWLGIPEQQLSGNSFPGFLSMPARLYFLNSLLPLLAGVRATTDPPGGHDFYMLPMLRRQQIEHQLIEAREQARKLMVEQRQANEELESVRAMLEAKQVKKINDTHGHEAGDNVLRELALYVLSCIREHDLLARIGGEEFALLLANVGRHAAACVAGRIRQGLHGRALAGHNITISAGVAAPENGDSSGSLMLRADQALYRAKRDGRDGRDRVASA